MHDSDRLLAVMSECPHLSSAGPRRLWGSVSDLKHANALPTRLKISGCGLEPPKRHGTSPAPEHGPIEQGEVWGRAPRSHPSTPQARAGEGTCLSSPADVRTGPSAPGPWSTAWESGGCSLPVGANTPSARTLTGGETTVPHARRASAGSCLSHPGDPASGMLVALAGRRGRARGWEAAGPSVPTRQRPGASRRSPRGAESFQKDEEVGL